MTVAITVTNVTQLFTLLGALFSVRVQVRFRVLDSTFGFGMTEREHEPGTEHVEV
jgi:hypothetical protein